MSVQSVGSAFAPVSPLSTSLTSARVGATAVLVIVPGCDGACTVRVIVVDEFGGTSGLITLDPGYGNTGACTSAITCGACAA